MEAAQSGVLTGAQTILGNGQFDVRHARLVAAAEF
jgi:hypothetical protein